MLIESLFKTAGFSWKSCKILGLYSDSHPNLRGFKDTVQKPKGLPKIVNILEMLKNPCKRLKIFLKSLRTEVQAILH